MLEYLSSVIVRRDTSVALVIRSNGHVRIIHAKAVANVSSGMENFIAGMWANSS